MTLSRPQRIIHTAPIGSLMKHHAPALTPRKLEGERDPTYLALVQQCPCLKCGMDPAGVAAHLRLNSAAFGKRQAMAKKPSDGWTTPLCSGCHLHDADAQHRVGEDVFWQRLGVNPFLVCQRLYAQRGDLVAMRAVVFVAIAERRST
jgi:hypothetical protein